MSLYEYLKEEYYGQKEHLVEDSEARTGRRLVRLKEKSERKSSR